MRGTRPAGSGPQALPVGPRTGGRAPTSWPVRDHRAWLPGCLWVLSVVLAAWAAPTDTFAPTLLVLTTVGATVAWLRHRSPIGWLLLADGLVWLGGSAAHAYASSPGPLRPGAEMAAAFFDLAGWVVAVALVPLLLVVFPDGRAPGRPWKLVAWLIIGGGGALATASLLTPGPLPSWPGIANPFGVGWIADLAAGVSPLAQAAFAAGLAGALASVVVRFRRSTGIERQQLRWLVAAAVLLAVSFAVGGVAAAAGLAGAWVFNVAPLLVVPVAIGGAVLRHRLWDLDVVIARTLTYGVLGLAVVAVYVVVVAGVGTLVGAGAGSDVWLVALATAIVGAVLHPLADAARGGVRQVVFRDPAEPRPALLVRTLGGFRVEREGIPVERSAWQSRKARQLLKMLVAARGRPVHREVLADRLWPDATSGNLANRLSVALSTVRSVLDPGKVEPSDHFVGSDPETAWIDLEHLVVDVEVFLSAAEVGLRGRGDELEVADALYRGDFLGEDLYEDWAQPLRDHARTVHLQVLRARASDVPGGNVDAVVAAQRRILQVDPYDEVAHRAVVAALQAAGRHGEAHRAHRYHVAMMGELGMSPDAG